jgi:dTDP-4-amino-4,6-dideoxygalactose transaminase
MKKPPAWVPSSSSIANICSAQVHGEPLEEGAALHHPNAPVEELYVPFNKPFLTGLELDYIAQTIRHAQTSGNGPFTRRCHQFFSEQYGFERCLLTSSCTDALEMSALLLDIQPGDEVIIPAYTFVSTANAFALRGAKIIFADSCTSTPNIDPEHVAQLISPRTKAIVVVHYGGIACDMDRLLALSTQHRIPIVEDAAHAIDSYHRDSPLGSLGAIATFSFHETKNIICGEGGLLVVNDPSLWHRAEIIWEKGTNRVAFARKEVQKYRWVDIGSSFLPSDITAAFLLSQLESLPRIQQGRVALWHAYKTNLEPIIARGLLSIPEIPDYATVNGHLFPIIARSPQERNDLIEFLLARGVHALFHYLPLNESPFYTRTHVASFLPNASSFAERLVRLPLFYELSQEQLLHVCSCIAEFFRRQEK